MSLIVSPTRAFEWPHEGSDLVPDPDITFGKLDNGMGYAIRRASEPPGRVSLRLVVQAGSIHEEEDERGLAHFLEHMAFNGTRGFPEGEMIEYFQRLGMAFGADTNANTGFRRTQYKLDLPENSASLRDESLRLLRDYADGILFEPEAIEAERGIILAEKVTRDSASMRVFENEIDFTFPGTLFPDRLPIGTEEAIKSLTRKDFMEFYRERYRPGNTFLVVAGDIDPVEWEAAIRQAFASFGENALPDPGPVDPGELDLDEGLRVGIQVEPELGTVNFTLSQQSVPPIDVTTAEGLDERIRQSLISSIMRRRFERLSRMDDSGIVNGYAGVQDFQEFSDWSYVYVEATPEKWREALADLEQAFRGAREEGFSEIEIREAVETERQNARKFVETSETRRSSEWADLYARRLDNGEVLIAPEAWLERVMAVTSEVTPEDLHASFRRAWDGATENLFVAGPLPEGVGEPEIRAAFGESRAVPLSKAGFELLEEFPYEFADSLVPVSETRFEDLNVTRIDYPGEVVAFIRPNPSEKDQIEISLSFGVGKAGLSREVLPGLPAMASSFLVPGGTGLASHDDLKTLLSGENQSLSFFVEDDRSILAGKTNREDFGIQADVILAYFTDAAFRPDAFGHTRRMLEGEIREARATVDGLFRLEAMPALRGGDPRFAAIGLEGLAKIEPGRLREWFRSEREVGPIEIAVSGDFVPAELRPHLDRMAAALATPGLERGSPVFEGPSFPAGETIRIPVASNVPQAAVLLAFPTQGQAPIEVTRRLGVLSEVITDRMRIRIREDLGQAYSYFAFNLNEGRFPYGALLAAVFTSPENLDSVATALDAVVLGLRENPVTEDERQRALEPVNRQIEKMVRSNAYWLRVLGGAARQERQLDWARSIMSDFRSVTTADLNGLVEEFIVPGKSARIQISTGFE